MPEPNIPLAPSDLSLIHRYTKDDDSRCCLISVTRFSNGQKNLYDINAAHVAGTDNPTCKTIAEAIVRYKPQAMVIESTNDKGFSADTPMSTAVYADSLARAHNIKVIAGEPSDSAVLDAMLDKGYSAKDVMAFYMLRSIPQGKRNGTIVDEESFARVAKNMLDMCFAGYKGEKITLPEFKAWYEAHKADNKGFLGIEISDIAPDASPDATYFQKLSAQAGIIRDRHIIGTIANALNAYDNVLVVYGGAHLVQSQPVFEQMFGSKGETIQLVPDGRETVWTNKVNPDAKPGKQKEKLKFAAKVTVALLGMAAAFFLRLLPKLQRICRKASQF